MLSLIRERPTRQSYTWVLCSHYLEDVTTSAASSDGWVAEIEHADPLVYQEILDPSEEQARLSRALKESREPIEIP
jgi:hypothetical protein